MKFFFLNCFSFLIIIIYQYFIVYDVKHYLLLINIEHKANTF